MDPLAHVTELVLATGALGTAAFGIVEGLKPMRIIGEAGFGAITETLGKATLTLAQAHGPQWETIYRGLYRGDQAELARLLRQGARIGLVRENAADVGAALFGPKAPEIDDLVAITAHLYDAAAQGSGEPATTDAQRRALGRFELAIDARIDAALALARQRYAATARVAAFVVSLIIAVTTALIIGDRADTSGWPPMLVALLVGLAAVPIAPIAKDVASGIQAAAKALKGR